MEASTERVSHDPSCSSGCERRDPKRLSLRASSAQSLPERSQLPTEPKPPAPPTSDFSKSSFSFTSYPLYGIVRRTDGSLQASLRQRVGATLGRGSEEFRIGSVFEEYLQV